MKIAILNIYSGLVNRGAETVANALATRWADKNEVLLLAGGSIAKTNYKVHIMPGIGLSRSDPTGDLLNKLSHWFYRDENSKQVREFTLRCFEELEKFAPDIILSFNGSEQVRVLHSNLQFRDKVVVGMHGQTENRRWKLAGRENTRLIELKPKGLVAINSVQYKLLKNTANKASKITQIPDGVDLDFFNPKATKTKLSLQSPVVLCVAGLQPYKRIDLLLRAVATTNFSVLILGDGPLRDELIILGTHLLGRDRFEIMTVPHDLIPGIYAGANVFSLPSEPLEAFGVSYLEAMACNVPVVAPDDIVRRNIVGNAGLFTDVENPKMYGKALMQANSMSWGNTPREQARKFEWDDIAQQYIEFFNQIVL